MSRSPDLVPASNPHGPDLHYPPQVEGGLLVHLPALAASGPLPYTGPNSGSPGSPEFSLPRMLPLLLLQLVWQTPMTLQNPRWPSISESVFQVHLQSYCLLCLDFPQSSIPKECPPHTSVISVHSSVPTRL